MGEWRVQILGEDRDLNTLKVILSTSDPLIVEEEGELFIKSSAWNDEPNVEVVRNHAQRFVEQLDHSAFFYFRDTALISIGNIARLKPDGTKDWYVFVEGSLSITSRLAATATIIDT